MQSARVASFPIQAPGLRAAFHLGDAWTLTCIVIGIDAIWLIAGGWSMAWRDVAVVASAVAAFMAPLAIGRYRRDLRIRSTLRAAALLIAFQAAGATLSYLVISTGASLVDTQLAAWDRAIGFDWLALHAWLEVHPTVQTTLRFAYYSGLLQLVFVVLFLGLSERPAQLDEFMRLFITATLLVVLMSGPLPAAGAWKHYGLDKPFDLASLSHFELLRSGSMHEIPLGRMQGLISIPSLHAAMAVLITYAMRRTVAFAVVVVLNAAMLASTPVDGGHYLVDLLAGVALAIGLILFERRASFARGRRTFEAPCIDRRPHLGASRAEHAQQLEPRL